MKCWKMKFKKIPFSIAPKIIQCLVINFTKEMKSCTLKTIKHCLNKLKKPKINGKIFYVHELEKVILLKCSYYPKTCPNLTQSLSKAKMTF